MRSEAWRWHPHGTMVARWRPLLERDLDLIVQAHCVRDFTDREGHRMLELGGGGWLVEIGGLFGWCIVGPSSRWARAWDRRGVVERRRLVRYWQTAFRGTCFPVGWSSPLPAGLDLSSGSLAWGTPA